MKSLTLTAAIIVIAVLFVVPTIREEQVDERFEGRPFPASPSPKHELQVAKLAPSVGRASQAVDPDLDPGVANSVLAAPSVILAPPSADTADAPVEFDFGSMSPSNEPSGEVADPPEVMLSLGGSGAEPADFGLRFDELNGNLVVSKIEAQSAADAYGVQVDDTLLKVDDAKLTSEADFQLVSSGKLAGDAVRLVLLRGSHIVEIDSMRLGAEREVVTAPDGYLPKVELLESLSADIRRSLLGNPFDKPITKEVSVEPTSSLPNDNQLARIYTGQGQSASGDESSHVELNPYASSSNSLNGGIATRPPRPVARPRFDAIPTGVSIEGKTALTEAEVQADTQIENEPQEPVALTQLDAETPEPLPVEPAPFTAEELPTAGEPTLADAPNDDLEIQIPIPQAVQVESTSPSDAQTPEKLEPVADPIVAPVAVPALEPLASPSVVPQEQPQAQTTIELPPHIKNALGAAHSSTRTTASLPPHDMRLPPVFDQGCAGCDGATGFGTYQEASSFSTGGWLSAGYHSASNNLFNDRPDQLALHQGWLFAEKRATANAPIGFRFDVLYGIDGQDTQAFGNDAGVYDFQNGFDYGSYGWALPQAYVEIALGDWEVRVGHFSTLLGYESVGAANNFFYSHSMSNYNSEPFTHTGVLGKRTFGDVDVFAGWTLGWDTGFDAFGDGSSWLGGMSYNLNECTSLSYFSSVGDFGRRGSDGFANSLVLDVALTRNLNSVLHSDYLRIGSTGEDNVALNHYLTYSLSEKVAIGTRLEWWKGDVLTGYAPHGGVLPAAGSLSYYAATLGVNIRPADSLVLRPEVRHDWSPAAGYEETYFGVDAVWSF